MMRIARYPSRSWLSAPAGVVLAAAVLSGCTLGTMDEEELLADYEIQWAQTPETRLADLQERLDDRIDAGAYGIKRLRVGDRTTMIELRELGSGRVYSYVYNARGPFGPSLRDGELEATNDDDPDESLFAFSDLPVEDLERMIEATRAESPFQPASLQSISFERDDDPGFPLEVMVHVHTVGDSHYRTFTAGEAIEMNTAGSRSEDATPEPAPPTAEASLGQPVIEGDMSKRMITAMLQRRLRAITACLQSGPASDFELQFNIDDEGYVRDVNIAADGALDPTVESCVVSLAERMRTPSAIGAPASVRFPIVVTYVPSN